MFVGIIIVHYCTHRPLLRGGETIRTFETCFTLAVRSAAFSPVLQHRSFHRHARIKSFTPKLSVRISFISIIYFNINIDYKTNTNTKHYIIFVVISNSIPTYIIHLNRIRFIKCLNIIIS